MNSLKCWQQDDEESILEPAGRGDEKYKKFHVTQWSAVRVVAYLLV